MPDRPIIFSGPMVRAMLAGRKTQPHDDFGALSCGHFNPTKVDRKGEEYPGPEVFGAWSLCGEWGVPCRYGAPGDRLWVREKFAAFNDREKLIAGSLLPFSPGRGFAGRAHIEYAADERLDGLRWRSPMKMPRWCSRLSLEVTGVRVERLQEITEADAIAEGFERETGGHPRLPGCAPIEEFRCRWDALNEDRGHSWSASPWVWCIEFRRAPDGA